MFSCGRIVLLQTKSIPAGKPLEFIFFCFSSIKFCISGLSLRRIPVRRIRQDQHYVIIVTCAVNHIVCLTADSVDPATTIKSDGAASDIHFEGRELRFG